MIRGLRDKGVEKGWSQWTWFDAETWTRTNHDRETPRAIKRYPYQQRKNNDTLVSAG